ncbi:Coronatine-insensitive protein 1 [Dionaea muscipula]
METPARYRRGMSDEIMECVITYVTDPRDRAAISLVCRRWYEIDALTRKHVTIAFCYTSTPDRLLNRFRHIEVLKLKGKPRAAMFNLIPENWGGYVTPWINIADSFPRLKSLHFRRMIITDADLETLAALKGRVLESLTLEKCSGYSTDGLLHIGRSCRSLRTLIMEECSIEELNGDWLHEVALNNTVLETLNFYLSWLDKINVKDLELIASTCPLVSLKVCNCEMTNLITIFQSATTLEEFGGGSFDETEEVYPTITFPTRLRSLCITYLGRNEMQIIFPVGHLLKKLDLVYALLGTEDHCNLIQRCPNLEVLETTNVLGDNGLDMISLTCKKLKRLRIERGADEQVMEDAEGVITQRGMISLSLGCRELEYIAFYASDITNEALESIGSNLKNLSDFRLVILDGEENVTDLPLDKGVRALLLGCQKLRRLAFYLRRGGLTDLGLSYVGLYSQHVRWMLLGYVGESDEGILQFSRGCPNLERLELRCCPFSERAIAQAASDLRSLKYLWVQGYNPSPTGFDLSPMLSSSWNIELIPARREALDDGVGQIEYPAQIIAYRSLVGHRTDFPDDRSVVPFTLP